MGLFDMLKKKEPAKVEHYKYADMLNGTMPIFSSFGKNIYVSDVVRQAVMCIVTEAQKLEPQHIKENGSDIEPVRDSIQAVLDNPNPLMTTSDFIAKIIWLLYEDANAFIIPVWDGETLKELHPVKPSQKEFLKDKRGNIYIKLRFVNGYNCTLLYDDIIHLRREFSTNEFLGGGANGEPDHTALFKTLELNNTLLEGVTKALKSSFSINGVIKYKTMMDGGKTDRALEELTRAIKNNESGFLPLDLAGEFVPFKREIKLVDADTLKFIDSKILRHFGVPIPILSGEFSKAQYEAFYQKTIEPLIVSMSQAFTKCLLTRRQNFSFRHKIVFYAEKLIFLDTGQKLELVRNLGDSGTLYQNEIRSMFGLKPLPELVGVRMQSLNYVNADIAKTYQLGLYGSKAQEETTPAPTVEDVESEPAEEVLENE